MTTGVPFRTPVVFFVGIGYQGKKRKTPVPDSRFFTTNAPLSVTEVCALSGAELLSAKSAADKAQALVRRVASIEESDLSDALVYATSLMALARLEQRPFGLCLTSAQLASQAGDHKLDGPLGVCTDPKLSFCLIASELHDSLWEAETRAGAPQFISSTAQISADAVIGPGAIIGSGVEIGRGARIGAGAIISHAVIGENVVVGAGVVIGAPGFGFVAGPDGLRRMPQLGIVEIEKNVEIGANCTIDRAALGVTVIGAGTKIDNLVHIGHNVRVGRNVVIVAQAGIGGSTTVGDGAVIGGQVGIADHITIGAGAHIASKSGIMRDVPAGEKWGGYPGRRAKDWLRETLHVERETKKQRKTK